MRPLRRAVCCIWPNKWDFVHANELYLLRLADGGLLPIAPAMRSGNTVQVVEDRLLIHTDLDAPRGRLCGAPLSAPTRWRTLIAEDAESPLSSASLHSFQYVVQIPTSRKLARGSKLEHPPHRSHVVLTRRCRAWPLVVGAESARAADRPAEDAFVQVCVSIPSAKRPVETALRYPPALLGTYRVMLQFRRPTTRHACYNSGRSVNNLPYNRCGESTQAGYAPPSTGSGAACNLTCHQARCRPPGRAFRP